MSKKPEISLREWPVQDAKARFSELVTEAERHGPQLVTRRGEPAVVVVSADQWLRAEAPKYRTVKEWLLAPDARIDDLPVADRGAFRPRRIPRF